MWTKKVIVQEDGQEFTVGDPVDVLYKSGMGIGGAEITKITDTGFWFDDGKIRRVQYAEVERLRRYG